MKNTTTPKGKGKQGKDVRLYNGDCLDVLKDLKDNSVDSIVTDPPYELGFMGKSWDSTGIANNVEMWAECLRVLKPGGHLLAFSGTRTYHRMAVAIEDAGFEVRDMIEWVYGSGFPKSLNIGKMLDKRRGTDEAEFAKYIKESREKVGITKKQLNEMFGYVAGASWWEASGEQFRYPNWADYQKLKGILYLDDRYDKNLKEMVGEKIGETIRGNAGFSNEQVPRPWKEKIGETIDKNAPATDEAKQWEGWGTALKPAHEPICMARKPLAEKTVAENCLKWGTGGINIDESRVGTDELKGKKWNNGTQRVGNGGAKQGGKDFHYSNGEISGNSIGRFPANLIHDNSEEVRECFPESKSTIDKTEITRGTSKSWFTGDHVDRVQRGDSGNASRFFKSIIYQAKASKSERNKGCEDLEEKDASKMSGGEETRPGRPTNHPMRTNHHPTVKPIALMEYLIKMVTPKGGVVLDPFMGSGSTGVAAKKNNYDFIGIEMEKDYIEIAKKRIYEKESR